MRKIPIILLASIWGISSLTFSQLFISEEFFPIHTLLLLFLFIIGPIACAIVDRKSKGDYGIGEIDESN